MERRNEEEGPRTRLEKIELDLGTYKILLHFQDQEEPLALHFDTPSRRFYFALIALMVAEMKNMGKPEFIYIRKHEKILKLLDHALAGQHASETTDGMWGKIRKAWYYTLPDLEEAAHFKILDRHLIPPYEKGGKYRYECSDEECDTWANLFVYDENNPWRFKLAIDSVSLDLEDISLIFGDLRDNAAWQGFVKGLSAVEKPAAEEKEIRERAKPKRWYRAAVAAGAILIIAAAGVTIRHLWFRPVPPQVELAPDKKLSIAILPFVNMDGNPDNEYFCDGITEELINYLARVRDLHVISRTSVFYLKDKVLDLKTIGKKLNVDHVLEGSVRVSGDKLRISAQLIKTADDSHLWAETYDREMKDIFITQENLAQEIACSLKSRLGCNGDEVFSKRYTENVEAYQLYLKGRYFENKMSYDQAIAYFEQALALDPNYALAYAGLANVYNLMAFFLSGSVNVKEYYLKGKEAAMKALEIDDMLSEAHAVLGHLKVHYEWDWRGAERALKRAIELNPGHALAHECYANYLWAIGRLDQGIAESKIALELDPLSFTMNAIFGHLLASAHKDDQAIEQRQKTLELYPNHPMAMAFLGFGYMEIGKHEDGIALIKKAVGITRGKSPFPLGCLGYAYGVGGKREEAQEILDEALDRSKQGYFSPFFIATIYMGLGDKDKAFQWLEKAYETRDPIVFPVKTVSHFRSLHSDPRFIELLKKMGLEG